jgi:hypothetical protein
MRHYVKLGEVYSVYCPPHVVAAALRGQADTIVTANLKDFPDEAIKPWGLSAISPDDFLLDLLDLSPALVLSEISDQAASMKNPPSEIDDVLISLGKAGVKDFAKRARELVTNS